MFQRINDAVRRQLQNQRKAAEKKQRQQYVAGTEASDYIYADVRIFRRYARSPHSKIHADGSADVRVIRRYGRSPHFKISDVGRSADTGPSADADRFANIRYISWCSASHTRIQSRHSRPRKYGPHSSIHARSGIYVSRDTDAGNDVISWCGRHCIRI